MVGRLLSYWEGNFSGAMLNFGGVISSCFEPPKNNAHVVFSRGDKPLLTSVEPAPGAKQQKREPFGFHGSWVEFSS